MHKTVPKYYKMLLQQLLQARLYRSRQRQFSSVNAKHIRTKCIDTMKIF